MGCMENQLRRLAPNQNRRFERPNYKRIVNGEVNESFFGPYDHDINCIVVLRVKGTKESIQR
jgi:hypothetical protein